MATDGPAPGGRAWTRAEMIIVAAGTLLVVDLVFAPWHRFAIDVDLEQFGIALPSFRMDRRGIQNPQAFFGIASAVVAALMVVHVVATKVSSSVPRAEQLHLVAGAVVLGLVVAKLLANNGFLGIGAWAGICLAAALAYGGFLLSQQTSADTGRRVPTP